jgi:hypothetical protein
MCNPSYYFLSYKCLVLQLETFVNYVLAGVPDDVHFHTYLLSFLTCSLAALCLFKADPKQIDSP